MWDAVDLTGGGGGVVCGQFHPGAASGNNDVAYSWSPESLPYDGSGKYCPTGGGPGIAAADDAVMAGEVAGELGGGPAMSPRANEDSQLAQCGARTLRRLQADQQHGNDTRPFFFCVGFHKPHIPWTVPQEYYDRYPLSTVHLAPNTKPPVGVFLSPHQYRKPCTWPTAPTWLVCVQECLLSP